jgi:Tfp pilus assembly protein PilF
MAGVAEKFLEKALLAIKDRDYARAEGLLVEVIKLKPDLTEAWVLRGNVRMVQDASFDALLHYDRVLQFDDKLHDAWNNRGIACGNIALWDMAIDSLQKSAEIMPCMSPYINMASIYCSRNMLVEAEACYRKAIAFAPENLEGHTNLGITLLGQGKWKEGWEEYYARHDNTAYQMRSRRIHKTWQGQSLKGKTILLYPEQGLGDEIMFMRFAVLMKERCEAERVILESMPPLLRLAGTVEGVDRTAIKNETDPEGVDYSCAIMDVPGILDIGPDDLPVKINYLKVPMKAEAPKVPSGMNVGLCWESGQRPLQPDAKATGHNKSIPLEMFRPMTKLGINLISLQKDNPEPRLAKEFGIIDYMKNVTDLADTAALIKQLDLVISVDTAVAHLAGALGKPVWNFVRFSGYWPWLDAWRETKWYPSMRIYRQPTNFVWHTPINEMMSDLEELLAA